MKLSIELERSDIDNWSEHLSYCNKLINNDKKGESVSKLIERINKFNNRYKYLNNEKALKMDFWPSLVLGVVSSRVNMNKGSYAWTMIKILSRNKDWFFKSDNNVNVSDIERKLDGFDIKLKKRKGGLQKGYKKKVKYLIENAAKIKSEWNEIFNRLNILLRDNVSISHEREVADFLKEKFKGIGLKQSRIVLQNLGLTRHVIPIDSRMMNVLKSKLNFENLPTQSAFQDEHIYIVFEDYLSKICRNFGLPSYEFDALIFYGSEEEKRLQKEEKLAKT